MVFLTKGFFKVLDLSDSFILIVVYDLHPLALVSVGCFICWFVTGESIS